MPEKFNPFTEPEKALSENVDSDKDKRYGQNVSVGEALRPEQNTLLRELKNDLAFLEYSEVVSDIDFHPYNRLDEIKKLPKQEKKKQ